MENIDIDEITEFKFRKIEPENYGHYQHISVVSLAMENTAISVFMATFKYKGLDGYLPVGLTEAFIADTQIDIDKFMKQKCLRWARKHFKGNAEK